MFALRQALHDNQVDFRQTFNLILGVGENERKVLNGAVVLFKEYNHNL